LMLTAATGGIKNAPRRRRIINELARRPHRTRRKIPIAVGAHPFETVLDAIAAEGAFERADHCVGGRWRQVSVAAFAAWSKFEHSDAFP
jgi:predicted lipid carrier protein YhbT